MIITTGYFRSKAMPILNQGDITQNLNEAKAEALGHLEKFLNEGSGWRLKRCETLDLGIVQYRPFRGLSYIKTPAYISPWTIINVKNNEAAALSEPSSQHYTQLGLRIMPTAQRSTRHI